MTGSLESSRPMMAPSNRASVRYSTFSMAPTTLTTDSAQNEITDIQTGLDRMENKALSSQRVTLSEEQTANMSKIALGAKVERALERRMSSQDAVMRRPMSGGVSPGMPSTTRPLVLPGEKSGSLNEKQQVAA